MAAESVPFLKYHHMEVSEDKFVEESVKWLHQEMQRSIQERGKCLLGLSGGSTPGPIYEQLGKFGDIAWEKVWIFLVDERYISKENKDSNCNLVSRTLLLSAGDKIPRDHVIFPNTELPLQECVADYGNQIKALIDNHGSPSILTLGLGPDGHIASLFPPVVKEGFEDGKPVIHTTTTKFAVADRFTLTMPIITSAHQHVFFMKGKDKLDVWSQMLQTANEGHERWPALDVLKQGHTNLILGK